MRSTFRNNVFAVTLVLASCGGDNHAAPDSGSATDAGQDGGSDPLDAGHDAALVPGTDFGYVVSAIRLPTNGSEATAYGLDIDGKPADGNGIDNSLGGLIASIGAVAGMDLVQEPLNQQIATGTLISLVNIHASELTDAEGADVSFYFGATDPAPTPAPCANEEDTVCGNHLLGTGMFTLDDTGATDETLEGDIVSGTFTGGPGTVTLRLFFSDSGDSMAVLPLQNARVELSGLTADGWAAEGSKLGGAISNDDIANKLMPAFADFFRKAFDESCSTMEEGGLVESNCDCTGQGSTIQALLDRDPEDCAVDDNEVSSFLDPLLMRDIDLDEDGSNDAVSIGVGLTGVRASFMAPAN